MRRFFIGECLGPQFKHTVDVLNRARYFVYMFIIVLNETHFKCFPLTHEQIRHCFPSEIIPERAARPIHRSIG